MRVFVTGASGFIGTAIVRELLRAGHQVLGLARSEASAAALAAAGAEVHRGDLNDPQSLQRGVAAADGVIHTGFIHDFSNFAANCEVDKRAITAMGETLAGTNKPIIITSGTGLLDAAGRTSTESDEPRRGEHAAPRFASEDAARAIAAQGVKASILRLPPSVHGDGDHGFVPALIGIAREKGVSGYIGDGNNRWPAVHRDDAARAYLAAVEKGAIDPVYHTIGDAGIPTKEIAAVIARKLNLPLVSVPKEEAAAHFSWLAHFFALDTPSSSELTKSRLGWQPVEKGLIEDMENGTYFG